MRISKDDAEKMDRVLFYLVKDNKARVKSKQIQNLLGIGFDDASHIYDSIFKYNKDIEPVISILFASNISARPVITEEFLKKGGFTAVSLKQYNLEVPLQSPENRRKKKQINIMSDKKGSMAIVISILAFLIALLSLFYSLGILN